MDNDESDGQQAAARKKGAKHEEEGRRGKEAGPVLVLFWRVVYTRQGVNGTRRGGVENASSSSQAGTNAHDLGKRSRVPSKKGTRR